MDKKNLLRRNVWLKILYFNIYLFIIKEIWARPRCGSIGRERNKGFKDSKCRLCKVDAETLVHISVAAARYNGQ